MGLLIHIKRKAHCPQGTIRLKSILCNFKGSQEREIKKNLKQFNFF